MPPAQRQGGEGGTGWGRDRPRGAVVVPPRQHPPCPWRERTPPACPPHSPTPGCLIGMLRPCALIVSANAAARPHLLGWPVAIGTHLPLPVRPTAASLLGGPGMYRTPLWIPPVGVLRPSNRLLLLPRSPDGCSPAVTPGAAASSVVQHDRERPQQGWPQSIVLRVNRRHDSERQSVLGSHNPATATPTPAAPYLHCHHRGADDPAKGASLPPSPAAQRLSSRAQSTPFFASARKKGGTCCTARRALRTHPTARACAAHSHCTPRSLLACVHVCTNTGRAPLPNGRPRRWPCAPPLGRGAHRLAGAAGQRCACRTRGRRARPPQTAAPLQCQWGPSGLAAGADSPGASFARQHGRGRQLRYLLPSTNSDAASAPAGDSGATAPRLGRMGAPRGSAVMSA